jgi:hypothetical protein
MGYKPEVIHNWNKSVLRVVHANDYEDWKILLQSTKILYF